MRKPDEPTAAAEFGPFRLDLADGRLFRLGVEVDLQRQPREVLLLLARRPGELLTREQIQTHLWAGRHVEAEAGINYCIRQIRAALGERADAPRFIETVRGQGYRFIGAESASTRWLRSGSPVRPSWTRRMTLGAAASIALLLGARLMTGPPEVEGVTVAMVPFANLTDNPACARMARWIAAAMRAAVSGASRGAVQFLGDPAGGGLPAAAAPRFLITGAISARNGHHEVVLQLIRSYDGGVVWTRSIETGRFVEGQAAMVRQVLDAVAPSRRSAGLVIGLGP